VTATGTSWLMLSVLLAATADGSPSIGQRIDAFTLKDALGTSHSLSDWKDSPAMAVIFIGTDCPLAKQYGSKLADLAQQYKNKGVQFVAIDSNQQDSLAAITNFARVNRITFPILKDPANQVADRFGAARTPEAFVLDAGRTVRYRGKIDDQFGVGYVRSTATRHHLADALDHVLAGKPVSTALVEAVGCRIGRVNRRPEKGKVTYSNQVARIVQARCVECHRTGQIAPFSLTSYKDVSAWAETVREVIDNQRMPPWYANPEYGHFSNDARMSSEEKRLISEWIENGCPEGDSSQLPPPATFAEGWRIPKPDIVVKMPKPFKVPATGVVDYKYFIVDPGFKHDVWIRAAEGKPSNRSVVHHMVLFYMPPGQDEPEPTDALLKAVASSGPGIPALVTPDGYARHIPAGSKLVFQMHYTPNGTPQTDQSEAGLVFADPATVKKEMQIGAVISFQFLIPPGATDYRTEAEDKFEQDTLLYALIPHMHLRGKAFRFVAAYPDGHTEILLDVPKYDFNWQNIYELSKPRLMPKGSALRCVAHFDNSDNNLVNPDPRKPVHFGEQTWDEMMVGMYYYALADQNLSLGKPHVKKSDGRSAQVERPLPVSHSGKSPLSGRVVQRVEAHGS
jgi:peroxiredoxin